jgi:hypothetical protein
MSSIRAWHTRFSRWWKFKLWYFGLWHNVVWYTSTWYNKVLDRNISKKLWEEQNQSYVTTDGQSTSLSWCQAPIWALRPDFYYCHTVAGLLMWDSLSDEKTGLSFTIAADPRQRSHSRVRIPWGWWSYFTVSDSRLPQPGGPGLHVWEKLTAFFHYILSVRYDTDRVENT